MQGGAPCHVLSCKHCGLTRRALGRPQRGAVLSGDMPASGAQGRTTALAHPARANAVSPGRCYSLGLRRQRLWGATSSAGSQRGAMAGSRAPMYVHALTGHSGSQRPRQTRVRASAVAVPRTKVRPHPSATNNIATQIPGQSRAAMPRPRGDLQVVPMFSDQAESTTRARQKQRKRDGQRWEHDSARCSSCRRIPGTSGVPVTMYIARFARLRPARAPSRKKSTSHDVPRTASARIVHRYAGCRGRPREQLRGRAMTCGGGARWLHAAAPQRGGVLAQRRILSATWRT